MLDQPVLHAGGAGLGHPGVNDDLGHSRSFGGRPSGRVVQDANGATSDPRSTVTALPVSRVRSPASRTPHRRRRAPTPARRAARSCRAASHQYAREHAVHRTGDRVFVDADLGREAARHDVVHAVVAGRGHVDAAHVGERAQRGEVGLELADGRRVGHDEHEELAGRAQRLGRRRCRARRGARRARRTVRAARWGSRARPRRPACRSPGARRRGCGTRAAASGASRSRLPEHVRARERGVAAEVDLDLGREPPQVEAAVGPGLHERGLRVLHLGRDRCIHASSARRPARAARPPPDCPRNGPDANASTTKIGQVHPPMLATPLRSRAPISHRSVGREHGRWRPLPRQLSFGAGFARSTR